MILGCVFIAVIVLFVTYKVWAERRSWKRTLKHILSLPEREPRRRIRW